MVNIFLHRVTTHKIQINTNDANFIDSQIITISYISLTCLNSTPQYTKKCSHYYYISFYTQLFSTSLLLIGTISGKVPCFITVETYYFWQVSRFPLDYIASLGLQLPFWATAEVVPCLLAPEKGDMAQVFPRIQSTSLPGFFRSSQGFYFLWVILYFLYRECY